MAIISSRRRLRFSLRSLLVTVTTFALIMACIGNLLRIHYAEREVALEIENAGGYVGHLLFGFCPAMDSRHWEGGPDWLHRVVFVRLSGTEIDDEQLSRLQLQRFTHLHALSVGYDAVFGIDGPKWESLPPPVTEKGLVELPPFPKLKYLSLWDLPVGDAGLNGLARKYPALECINLCGTGVTDVTMAEVGQLGQLRDLDLRQTLVTDAGLAHLAGLTNLRSLRLDETRVTGPGLQHLAGLSNLAQLHLRDTGVGDDDAHHLSGLVRLHTLRLWRTNIGDKGVSQLRTLQELVYLDLSDTAVTDAGVKHLVQLRQLKHLSLTGTCITDVGLAELSKVAGITSINLDGTGVTMNGIEHFLRRQPHRSVSFDTQIFDAQDLPDEG